MKLLYTNENSLILENCRNCISSEGIEVEIRNEFASGGVGELSPMQTWPELWVDESDYDRAKAIVDNLMHVQLGQIWTCRRCGEENESTFEVCWHCQADKI